MKSQQTTYSDNAQYVQIIGPRASPMRDKFGYYLTKAELRKYFGREGFAIIGKSNAWYNQIRTWQEVGWVTIEGNIDDKEADFLVWFHSMDVDNWGKPNRTAYVAAADAAGFNPDQVVFRCRRPNIATARSGAWRANPRWTRACI